MSNVKKPEPVAWRTYRSKRWCFAYSPNRKLCQCDSDWQGLITTEQAEAYKDACVREALEQAAQELERRRNLLINQNVVLDIKEGVAMYDLCAGAIRALIPKRQPSSG